MPDEFHEVLPQPVALPYAAPQPKRRRLIARASILILLLAAVLILAHQVPLIWRRAQLLYWQHRCLTFTPNCNRSVVGWSRDRPTPSAVAAPWERFYGLLSPPGSASLGTVFLGERVSPGGHHRLVALNLSWWDLGGEVRLWNISVNQQVFRLGSLDREPREVSTPYSYLSIGLARGDAIFAAPSDRSDQSHIAISCIVNGKPITVNGWLKDDDRLVWDRQDVGNPLER